MEYRINNNGQIEIELNSRMLNIKDFDADWAIQNAHEHEQLQSCNNHTKTIVELYESSYNGNTEKTYLGVISDDNRGLLEKKGFTIVQTKGLLKDLPEYTISWKN